MEFTREIIVEKPIEEVWNLLGNQYGEAYKWASGLSHSEGSGRAKFEGASCNNRVCDTSFGRIQEEIRNFDPKNYILQYAVIEGFPFFVETGINTWSLKKEGPHTKVIMNLVIQTKGFMGVVMGPMMKLQMGGITKNVIEDFKHYAETGKPSPRKAKEIEKTLKKAA